MESSGASSAAKLEANLEALDKAVIRASEDSGSTILVLPFGGRVIGAFAPGEGDNFLWTNPALNEVASGRALLDSGIWANSGGERTWLAPEKDFFYPDFPDFRDYFQPRGFDPGNYSARREGSKVILENRVILHSFRLGEDLELMMTKILEPLPLMDRLERLASGIEGTSYRASLELELRSGPSETPVGLWSLLQLPPSGTMLTATTKPAKIVRYFGGFGEGEFEIGESLFRWHMRSGYDRKLGLVAADVTGRLGYAYELSGRACLIVRDIEVDPRATYLDAPYGGSEGPACAVQYCSIDNERLGSFRELEYHSSAIGGKTGLVRIRSDSVVTCFRGSREGIGKLENSLFGLSLNR